MKRIYGVIFVTVFSLLVSVAAVSLVGARSSSSKNNFTFTSFDIQYELSRDGEGRSVLKTEETLVAHFPNPHQNRGIERAIPSRYNGHSTHVSVRSVTDETGTSLPFTTRTDNEYKIVRIGDPNVYVQGTKTYKITYTQRDVTRTFNDTGRDEWYWDTNGTEVLVPISQLSVRVKIDPSLTASRAGEPVCYQGRYGDSKRCSMTMGEDGSYTVMAADLARHENVTVAFGFEKGTFAQPKLSFVEQVLPYLIAIQVVTAVVAAILVAIFSVLYQRRTYRTKEVKPIIAEYIPPKDASVMVASKVALRPQYALTAQLIDLAVRRYISIVETEPAKFLRTAQYDIVIAQDLSTLREEEREVITDMFGSTPKVGDRLALQSLKKDHMYAYRLLDNNKKITTLMRSSYGLFEKNPQATQFFKRAGIVMVVVAILSLSIPFLTVAGILFVLSKTIRPLSDSGVVLRRYVLGLDTYIKASETERLAFLQGPDTAEKVGYAVDTQNPGQLVKLYERVLPYAILFGRERNWAKHLGTLYESAHQDPDWYRGTSAFNAALFVSALGTISQTTASYSGSGASSSSSGGSGGGGFSGGGGGGGGAGGW